MENTIWEVTYYTKIENALNIAKHKVLTDPTSASAIRIWVQMLKLSEWGDVSNGRSPASIFIVDHGIDDEPIAL